MQACYVLWNNAYLLSTVDLIFKWLYVSHNCIPLFCVKLMVYHFSIEVQNSEDFKDDRLSSPNEEVDTEPHSARSQDDICGDAFITRGNTQKVSSHRKHHISWTSSEVMKLIEGVSRCGVGRWAEIKRLMFSSSSRRTPVDLKVVHGIIIFTPFLFSGN